MAITTRMVPGTDTHTSLTAWEPIFTGSNLVKAAGGNSITESKMVPTTGMMVATPGAMDTICATMK